MKKQTCIEKILHARSIAVIGASNEKGSVGNEVILRLKATFTGRVYPVNLHEKTIEGLKCFKNVREVGKPIDVAIIAVPNTAVLGVIEDCHQADITSVVVLSAGFREIGAEGVRLEDAILAKLAQHKMHMIGPNCLGFINANDGSCEGFDYPQLRCFTVQFHPEACPGPSDTGFLFDRFIEMMRA